ncbi:hypothetical protein MTR_7g444810 [Medicago truncatula]|uniref:Uncharacterized protein n=1 Tax=Medicago truncatula TaxID=3880 RepID=A0A072TYX0_MEDTR|nr:hypothetical protein MTR_7g444810 [Medicago truncatula]
MTKSANIGVSMSSQSSQSSSQVQIIQASAPAMGASVSTVVGATMAMPVLTEMGITVPTTAPTVTTQMTPPEMETFVPPFTIGVPVSTSVPTSLNPQLADRDMAQLADRVRHVERLKVEKARTHKFERENVAYVDTNESDQEFDTAYEDVEDGEINFAELKHGPPYTWKVLRLSDGKNPIETQNDKYTPKTYTFDVIKCDEIFYLLVVDGQVAVPNGLKIPPLEQLKKRGFCKYHDFLGHKIVH